MTSGNPHDVETGDFLEHQQLTVEQQDNAELTELALRASPGDGEPRLLKAGLNIRMH